MIAEQEQREARRQCAPSNALLIIPCCCWPAVITNTGRATGSRGQERGVPRVWLCAVRGEQAYAHRPVDPSVQGLRPAVCLARRGAPHCQGATHPRGTPAAGDHPFARGPPGRRRRNHVAHALYGGPPQGRSRSLDDPAPQKSRPRPSRNRQYDAEADEMGHCAGKEADQQWLRRAMDTQTRPITASHLGDRRGIPRAGDALYGSLGGPPGGDSRRPASGHHQARPQNQPSRTLQQHVTPAGSPPRARHPGLLEDVCPSYGRD